VSGDDTSIGKGGASFPSTPASALWGVRQDDPVVRARAFASIVRAYWKPAYKRVRLRFRKDNEAGKDLTQAFFARALERGTFAGYSPEEARFRTFVRACLDNFVMNAEEARTAQKRGGHAISLQLDWGEAEAELSRLGEVEDSLHERVFDQEWVRGLVAMSLGELREQLEREGKRAPLGAFERYLLTDEDARPSYVQLAEELGVKVTDVTNYLHTTRKRMRLILLSKLREVTLTEEEFRDEALELFGIDVASE
jgi:DNA-directed RNA polymerase specialized sigma24 family protein